MKAIHLLFKSLFWLSILVGCGVFLLGLGSLERTPLVAQGQQLNRYDIKRAKLLLRRHNPRWQRPGQIRTLTLSSRELNLLANYLITLYGKGAARVSLTRGQLTIEASLHVPENPFGAYFNLYLGLSESDGEAVVNELRLGALDFPQFVVTRVLSFIVNDLLVKKEFQLDRDTLQAVRVRAQWLAVTYKWNPELVEQVRNSLLTDEEQRHLVMAHRQLAQALENTNRRRLTMNELLGLMFHEIAKDNVKNPVAANSASIIVMAAYVNGHDLTRLVSADSPLPKIKRLATTLRGRRDLAKHFIVSAALSASGGTELSWLLGLHKELSDAQGGSGFSFADLAADMAGSRFAEMLTNSPSSANRSQRLLATGLTEDAIMPPLSGFKEGLQELDFKRRYGSTESAAYRKVVTEIQRKIDRCEFYRG